MDPALQDLMKEAEKHPNEIAKIQAGFRGYKVRKEYNLKAKKGNKEDHNNPRPSPRLS